MMESAKTEVNYLEKDWVHYLGERVVAGERRGEANKGDRKKSRSV